MLLKATTSLLVLAGLVGSTLASTSAAHAKLTCKNVGKRWQICGDVKPGKKYVAGVGIRFSKKKPGFAANPPAPKKPNGEAAISN